MRGRWLAAGATLLTPFLHVAPAVAVTPPEGYVVESHEELAHGLEHWKLTRKGPAEVVHIARLAPDAAVELQAVLSNGEVAGAGARLERTSSMCARVRCLVAVNGDFAIPETGEPVGGVIASGRLLRSPSEVHHQVSIGPDGRLRAGPLGWSATLMPTDLRPIGIDGVNVSRADGQLVLYTPAYGPTTETNGFGVEVVGRVVEPAGGLVLGETALIELVELRDSQPAAAVPVGGIVLSGHGAGADELKDLWGRISARQAAPRVLLRAEADAPVAESVGGTPVLLRDGVRWFGESDDNFVAGRHPRTMVGWTASGDVLLVTVDGRQPGVSEGMSLVEAADLLLALGATEGINLDGGGSTSFVVDGRVANSPSDVVVERGGERSIVHAAGAGERVAGRVERPVVSGLAVVGKTPVDVEAPPAVVGLDLGLPQALALRGPSALDPGSVPDGDLPGLVAGDPALLRGRIAAAPARRVDQPAQLPVTIAAVLLSGVSLGLVGWSFVGHGGSPRRGRARQSAAPRSAAPQSAAPQSTARRRTGATVVAGR